MSSGKSDSAEVADHAPIRAPWVAGLVGGLLFALFLTGCVGVYLAATGTSLGTGLDRSVLEQMIRLRTPASQTVVTGFTYLGSLVPMLVLGTTLTLALCWRYQRWSVLVLMLIASGVSLTITEVGKVFFGRDRPPLADAVAPYEQTFSFPSGHTLNSTVVAGMLAYFVVWLSLAGWARVATVTGAMLWALLMGLSRVFLGHHWLTDVIFGWLAGLAWLSLLITVHQVLLRLRTNRSSSPSELPGPRRPGGRTRSEHAGRPETEITSGKKPPRFPTRTDDR